jgi:hypothetical protein
VGPNVNESSLTHKHPHGADSLENKEAKYHLYFLKDLRFHFFDDYIYIELPGIDIILDKSDGFINKPFSLDK